ncbi:response regulator transcription factor [Streptomyces ipomoeae]|uniref:response regulator transcription factor n=1 Tax=Streptomyces ipomoeae TaxID=103232 RepID=UPI00114786B4|nr:response regulator transcription factor [Streptomyces ipomoeae]MDX2937195.1 response regulator transcription factor [Streptomyces ipomoeae]TQE28554.1 response regulator transcription factor [Streptomyces ipomoeae]
MTIKVLLADDQELVRAGFKVLVNSTPDMEVVGEASDGREAVRLAPEADVVLMDIRMPGSDGLTATRQITSTLPDVRVLVLTTFEVDEYVFSALRCGASGFLGKGVEPAELQQAIRLVAHGGQLLSPGATRALIARFLRGPLQDVGAAAERLAALTEREREILVLVAAGLGNDAIAERLGISPYTAKTHVNRTQAKLRVHDRAQLVMLAYETGLVRVGSPPTV